MKQLVFLIFTWSLLTPSLVAGNVNYRVLAFYTAQNDQAHISFVKEAKKWFGLQANKHHFLFRYTDDWNRLNPDTLKQYQVILFLDTRPEKPEQRAAFEEYMRNGGAWMGFHFAAFALTPSDFPQDWNWYHESFLGCGQYKSNTWRPTSAILKIENHHHPATRHLPETIIAAPNEWYRWENNLRDNPEIEVLASIDPSSFPLGTGPKPHEIWHEGDYPVVWTNRAYHMIYFNMGHNDIDYEGHTNATLSSTFSSKRQDRMILDALDWLGHSMND